MDNNIIVGLDIGTTKIAAFIGQRSENGKVEILGVGKTDSTGVHRGEVRNIEEVAEAVKKAIHEAESKAEVEVHEVYVGIAGHHIKGISRKNGFVRQHAEELISKEDVEKLVNDQYGIMLSPGEQIIDIIVKDYIVDGEGGITNPVGMQGASLEANFHIVTGDVSNINRIYHSVEMAGYKIVKLILEPIASAEAVVDKTEKEAGICLVDIGGGTTDIAIFYDGVIRHTAVIPLAGGIITSDIKEGCSIIQSQAEALKIQFGSCFPEQTREDEIIAVPGIRSQAPREISMKRLAGIIHARMQLILEQVHYEIQNSNYGKKLIGGIVLTGGGSKIKHILELTSFITGIDTRIGNPKEHLTANSSEEYSHPMYATGIGLVLKGLAHSESISKEQEKTEVKSQPEPETEPIIEETTETSENEHKQNVWKKIKNMVSGVFNDPMD